jgi:hypothetical protein
MQFPVERFLLSALSDSLPNRVFSKRVVTDGRMYAILLVATYPGGDRRTAGTDAAGATLTAMDVHRVFDGPRHDAARIA